MNIQDEDFKVGLLQEFWEKRDQNLVPPSGDGMGIKKQKFLIFYNLMARSMDEKYTLSTVKAFEQGPVYYDIYSYIKTTGNFLEQKSIKKQNYSEDILNATLRLVESESSQSLSDFTHSLDLWKENYDKDFKEIPTEESIVFDRNNIGEKDISSKDEMYIKTLYKYYNNIYNNYNLEKIKGNLCAIEKVNKQKIIEILSKDKPSINKALEEVSKVDVAPKINYYEEFKDDELEGVTIDI